MAGLRVKMLDFPRVRAGKGGIRNFDGHTRQRVSWHRWKRQANAGFAGFLIEKKSKKSSKRLQKGIDFFCEVDYNTAVVCLGMKW